MVAMHKSLFYLGWRYPLQISTSQTGGCLSMFTWIFQETSFLAIRRSIFVSAFLLIIVVIYKVDIPIPFAGDTSGSNVYSKINYVITSIALGFYLWYLGIRSIPHGKKYLIEVEIERKKILSGIWQSMQDGQELVNDLKGIGNNPVRKLLPTEKQLSELRKYTLFTVERAVGENGLSNLTADIEELKRVCEKLNEFQEKFVPLFSAYYNDERLWSKVGTSSDGATITEGAELIKEVTREFSVAKDRLRKLKNIPGKIDDGISELITEAGKIERFASDTALLGWSKKLTKLLKGLDDDHEKLRTYLSLDSKFIDVLFPQWIAFVSPLLATLYLLVEYCYFS
ncbi:MAG: hypothetical protein NXI02_24990 [Rhodobacteraceae bacterium]|nr:hypothetical protein [Paracoccaceae bacterium]